jgi:two-component system, LytTR family, response regulator
MLKAIIIDDEKSCIDTLLGLIQFHNLPITILDTASSLSRGIELLQQYQPQLLFLDVEIGSEFGFEIFNHFSKPSFKVIFTTGHREYALQAIKASCIDYLVKPIDTQELIDAIHKAEQHFRIIDQNIQIEALKSFFSKNETDKKIALNTNTGYEIVNMFDIEYLEAESAYTHIYLSNGKKFTCSKTLKDIEEVLPKTIFFRCHRTYNININKISKLLKQDGIQVLMNIGTLIDVAVRKKDDFMALFNRL